MNFSIVKFEKLPLSHILIYGTLLFVTLIGLLLRLNYSNVRPIWLDEVHTFNVVNRPETLLNMLKYWWVTDQVTDPPLYYILNYLLVGGEQLAAFWRLRLTSVLFGTATIPLMYFTCRRIVPSYWLALATAALMAVNTLAIEYSQEYRPYSQLLFFSLLYFQAQLAVAEKFSLTRWIYLLISAAALIYTHFFGVFCLVSGYVFWGVWLLASGHFGKPMRLAFFTTPLLLLFLYVPVIMYGINKVASISASTGLVGSEARLYYANKAVINFWTDMPISLAAGTIRYTWSGMFLVFLATTGAVLLAISRLRLLLFTAGPALLICVMAYLFYELLRYPYASRRQISVLPFFVFFQAYAIYFLGAGKVPRLMKSFPLAVSFFFLILCLGSYGKQYVIYNSRGYRTQNDTVDWQGLAGYLGGNADTKERVAISSMSGIGSQYQFYHKRFNVQSPIVAVTTVEEIQRLFNDNRISGVWYLLIFNNLDENIFQYLLTHGQWKNFYGAAIVYLHRSEMAQETNNTVLLVPESGYYALVRKGGSNDYNAVLKHPASATLIASQANPPILPYGRGKHYFTFQDQASDSPTTTTLVPALFEGKWSKAINFSYLYGSNLGVNIKLSNSFEPALLLQYNGTVGYEFFVRDSGAYILTIEAKNDAPGPIELRIFTSVGGELPRQTFSRADNTFTQVQVPVQLKQGLNELKFYFPSYQRIARTGGDPADTITNFVFSRWRLDKIKSNE